MEIIKLPAHDLINLLEDKKLPLNYKIAAQTDYSFYINKYLYGIYQLKVSTTKYHYFRQINFKPIKIISPSLLKKENHQKIINTFQIENQPIRRLLIKAINIKSKLFFLYASTSQSQLISHYKVNLSSEIKGYFLELRKLLELDKDEAFFLIKELGLKIFNSLILSHPTSPRLKKTLDSSTHITLLTPYKFNLLPLNDNETFFFLDKATNLHHPIKWRKSKSGMKPNFIKDFALFSSSEDAYMEKEITAIKNIFQKKCRRPFSIYEQISKENIKKNLAYKDFVHLIYHGEKELEKDRENFHLLQNEAKLIHSSSLLGSPAPEVSKVPKVLILDVCYSKSENFIKNFFKLGGQTLIVGEGKIFTKNLAKGWEIFYWWLFYKKATVKTCFHKMIKKLLYLKDSNAFKFHLIGYGNENLSD